MVSEKEARVICGALISNRAHVGTLYPESIATEVLLEIDPHHPKDRVYALAHMMLMQIAREILRRKWDPDRKRSPEDQGELFELQDRYPRASGFGYVLRAQMTRDDVAHNVAWLRRTGKGYLAHADALEAWGVNREWDPDKN